MAKLKMQEYEVIGYRVFNFVGSDGKAVNGCNVYLRSVTRPDDLVGDTGFCQYIDYTRGGSYHPTLRDVVVPRYNEHGKVFDFEVTYVGS